MAILMDLLIINLMEVKCLVILTKESMTKVLIIKNLDILMKIVVKWVLCKNKE